jgi:hypothetical protein
MPQERLEYLRWEIPSHRRPERGRTWYIVAGVIIILMLFSSFFSFDGLKPVFLGADSNFLFVLIIILSAIIMIIGDSQPTVMEKVELGPDGVEIGQRFFDYDDIRNFSVIYKPKDGIKRLYFELRSSTEQRISLPLRNMDAATVYEFLKRYLDEDSERKYIPLSEQLTKLLKL